jgi:hypothetical protein
MINYSENILISILNRANVGNIYQKALINATNRYQIKPYNIVSLNPGKILEIYKIITQKYLIILSKDSIWVAKHIKMRIGSKIN